MRKIDLKRWSFRYGGLETNQCVNGLAIEVHKVAAEPKTPYGRKNQPHPDAYLDYMRGDCGGNGAGFCLTKESSVSYLGNSRWSEDQKAWIFTFLLVEKDGHNGRYTRWI